MTRVRTITVFIVRKILSLVVTLLAASALIFSLVAASGDPAASLVGGTKPDPQVLAQVTAQFHLDEPVALRYLLWLRDLVHGDLGTSYVYRSDVADLIAPRLGTSTGLVLYAGVLVLGLGIGLGLLGALGPGRLDRAVTLVTSVAMGAPTFVVAILLITVFSSWLHWLPVFGTGDGGAVDTLRHLTLPAVAMALAYVGVVAGMTRASVRSELHSEHVDTARVRGLDPRQYVPRHVLRNAAPQVLSVSGLTVAGLVAGTATAEQAFGIDGIGSLLVKSASRQDLPTVQILSLAVVAVFVLVTTAVDVVNAVLDPRLAGAGGRS